MMVSGPGVLVAVGSFFLFFFVVLLKRRTFALLLFSRTILKCIYKRMVSRIILKSIYQRTLLIAKVLIDRLFVAVRIIDDNPISVR